MVITKAQLQDYEKKIITVEENMNEKKSGTKLLGKMGVDALRILASVVNCLG